LAFSPVASWGAKGELLVGYRSALLAQPYPLAAGVVRSRASDHAHGLALAYLRSIPPRMRA